MASVDFRFAFSDSIAFLNAGDWDSVSGRSGVFMSRSFLGILEQNRPKNLTTHYALVYSGDRPVAAIVAQSLDIRVADLSAGHAGERGQGLWRSVGKAAGRSFTRVRRRLLVFGELHPSAWFDEAELAPAEPALWPEVASGLWRRWRDLLKTAEHAAGLPVAWIHERLLVCGNLLSTGPHGVAFAEGEDPSRLWPAVEEAVYRIRRSMRLFGETDLLMIKDLTDGQKEAATALRRFHFRRFETEPSMVLHFKPGWRNFEDCLGDMKSDYRSRIRKTLKELEAADIVLERIGPEKVRAMAPEIHRLYLQVHERQKLRLVTIGPGWIPALAEGFGDDFRTVIARPKGGDTLLGFVTVLRDGDGASGYYIGFDKMTAARGIPLYLGLVYAGVRQGIEMGARRISLGRTALAPKAQIGATPQPMYGYLRLHNPALNLAVPSILALLPAPDEPPERHPFKS